MDKNVKHVKLFFEHHQFESKSIESAWGIKYGDFYKLDNILFYATGYSHGDIVTASETGDILVVNGLIEESGNSTIRILFDNVNDVEITRKYLNSIDCQSELSNLERLISVNIPFNVTYSEVKKFLLEGLDEGKWELQEACISDIHRNQSIVESGPKNC